MAGDSGTSEGLDQHNHHHAGDEPLPAALDSLVRRIEADGAAWRASLPTGDVLAQRIHTLDQQAPEQRSPSYRFREELLMQDTQETGDTTIVRPATVPSERPAAGRLRGILAGTAAVVVVALFAALFLTLSQGTRGGAHTGASGKPTATGHAATQTVAPQKGAWQAIPTLAHVQAIPVVAPSDASVVYMARGTQLQRSADGGKTWSTLPVPSDFPQGAAVSWLDLFVSPIDANTLWATADLTTTSGATLPNCPVAPPPYSFAGGTVVASGSIPCQVQNVSTDGGQRWKVVNLGFASMLGSNSPDLNVFNYGQTYSQTPQAQADQFVSRLYMLTSNGPLASSGNGPRLAVSSDKGQSWQLADTQLASAGLHICDFAAAPGSRTLFAVTANTGCSPDYGETPALWRSVDAGAHWTQKTLPGGRLVAAIAIGGGPTPTLYALMPTLSGQSHAVNRTVGSSDVFASEDEGATWQRAPAAGIPTSKSAPTSASSAVTVLSDGSLMVAFTSYDTSASGQVTGVSEGFYTWKPGATAWQEQSRLHAGSVVTLQTTYTAGSEAFWLVTIDGASNGSLYFSVETYEP